MIIRLVKMTFIPEKVDKFLEIFNNSAPRIRAYPGCKHLELWEALGEPNVLFTYSIWESEEKLNHYRFSELFKETWTKTRELFQSGPTVQSLHRTWTSDS